MRFTAATVLCLALLCTAACSSDAEPSAPPSPADSVGATSQAPPEDIATVTATESQAEDTGAAPELPDEAREQTEAGAEAFALHYIETINHTAMSPEVGLLEPLATPDCESCRNHEATVEYSVEAGEVLRAPMWSASGLSSLLRDSGSRATVRGAIDQDAQQVFDSSGSVVSELEGVSTTLVLTLVWDDGWLVDEIQVEA